jgi:hypothetical protein
MQEEKTIVIDIRLTKGLAWTLVVVLTATALLLCLALTGEPAEASVQAQSTGMRQFYMTKSSEPANQAPSACAAGYHFASMWELADPSNLKYNASLGKTQADSGYGPPAALGAWVRTGYSPSVDNTPGKANCNYWTSLSSSGYGTAAGLPWNWTSSTAQDLAVWDAFTYTCDFALTHVWCIED